MAGQGFLNGCEDILRAVERLKCRRTVDASYGACPQEGLKAASEVDRPLVSTLVPNPESLTITREQLPTLREPSLIQVKRQERIRKARGKFRWTGELDAMRRDH